MPRFCAFLLCCLAVIRSIRNSADCFTYVASTKMIHFLLKYNIPDAGSLQLLKVKMQTRHSYKINAERP